MRGEPVERWPNAVILLGDHAYADEVSPRALDFIRARRDVRQPPGEEVADFEEYTRLYWEAWSDPVLRRIEGAFMSYWLYQHIDPSPRRREGRTVRAYDAQVTLALRPLPGPPRRRAPPTPPTSGA